MQLKRPCHFRSAFAEDARQSRYLGGAMLGPKDTFGPQIDFAIHFSIRFIVLVVERFTSKTSSVEVAKERDCYTHPRRRYRRWRLALFTRGQLSPTIRQQRPSSVEHLSLRETLQFKEVRFIAQCTKNFNRGQRHREHPTDTRRFGP